MQHVGILTNFATSFTRNEYFNYQKHYLYEKNSHIIINRNACIAFCHHGIGEAKDCRPDETNRTEHNTAQVISEKFGKEWCCTAQDAAAHGGFASDGIRRRRLCGCGCRRPPAGGVGLQRLEVLRDGQPSLRMVVAVGKEGSTHGGENGSAEQDHKARPHALRRVRGTAHHQQVGPADAIQRPVSRRRIGKDHDGMRGHGNGTGDVFLAIPPARHGVEDHILSL